MMFNGGSLLTERARVPRRRRARVRGRPGRLPAAARLQRRLKLNIGLYVQEYAASRAAVQPITELVNRNPTVFSRGFAYGNVCGEAEEKAAGSGMGAQRWMNW